MMNNINHWRKNVFCSKYELMSDHHPVGILKETGTCNSAIAEVQNHRYRFKVRGLLHQYVEVQDLMEDRTAGDIHFSCWWPKAKVNIGNQSWDWRFTDCFFRGFLMENDREKIYFESDKKGGEVFGDTKNELAVLSGLFVINYYRQMMIIYIAALLPIFLFMLEG